MGKELLIVIDYGSGNLRSAAKAFEHVAKAEGLDLLVRISARSEDVLKADRIVLPGQGAFGDCMNGLSGLEGMTEALNMRVIEQGAPFFGICVGMQLMGSRGMEHGVHAGLNWIEGDVVPLEARDPALKIPHMGWNTLHVPKESEQDNRHFVLRSVETSGESPDHFYFVHSFMFQCKYSHHVLGVTEYGRPFPSVVGRDNMIGIQFHPEKSQKAGLKLLGNFLRWKP
ncbi:MAG: imidazole glycerol phosphate synthase subunit HisH [Alphaproteobacteria bacterium]|nr:imidazole glycerol phosphate synthase subunit HisH [Alphaproteobacteria bacterium]